MRVGLKVSSVAFFQLTTFNLSFQPIIFFFERFHGLVNYTPTAAAYGHSALINKDKRRF